MKITFPHMGNAYISVKVLLDTIGLDYYLSPVGSRGSMEKGIENSPEFMCLPFKTILGDFIEGLNHGADTILFGGGCGQCRLSYYGDLHQEILRSMGYSFDYIHINLNKITYSEMINKLSPLIKGRSKALIAKAVTYSARTVFAVDGLYALAAKIRCREVEKGSVDAIMTDFEKKAQIEKGFNNIWAIIQNAKKRLNNIDTDKSLKPLKIAIVGEIFISSEPFANLEIEKKLGNLGAEVVNTMSVSMWIREHFLRCLTPVKLKEAAIVAANEYMHTDDIGGHGIYTIGNSELFSRGSCDGIIQIYPFTCMPEIIAESTFNAIREKHGVPIMTLIVDEMTGEAGFITRLEAFVDMLGMRRDVKQALTPKNAG